MAVLNGGIMVGLRNIRCWRQRAESLDLQLVQLNDLADDLIFFA